MVSGLRGAVAYACAKTFPNQFGNRPVFLFTTMAIVLFTVFCFGCTTECALNAFKIEMMVDEEKYMEENDTADKMSYLNEFEKKYIYPRIIRDYTRSVSQNNVELQNDPVDRPTGSPETHVPMSPLYHTEVIDSPKRRRQKSLYDYGNEMLAYSDCGGIT